MPRSSLRSRRAGAGGVVLGLALALAGCDDDDPTESPEAMAERVSDLLPGVVSADRPVPSDREAILRELAPMPTESLLVVYEVEGPGGLMGNLEVLARPGGLRRENWTLQVPLGAEGERRLDGSTIQTPDGIWVEGSPPETWMPSPLGAVADAYLALEPAQRRELVERLRSLRAVLAQARVHDESETEEILGVPCIVTRVATIEMCLWEATGLPLRYEGESLRLRALNIDTRASIGRTAFTLPFAPPRSALESFDAAAVLARFAQGETSELAPLLHPGFRSFGTG